MKVNDFVSNVDPKTVEGFGEEWSRFDQSQLGSQDLSVFFDRYFNIFPWKSLPENSVGFDLGCGSGRWAKCVAPRVGKLYCIDASEKALAVAERNLRDISNCIFQLATVDKIPLLDNSADFGYSLGVLHHVPDTADGIRSCVAKLKPGAPFLLYLYYAFDNRPVWFRTIWKLSDKIRIGIAQLPSWAKLMACQVIATLIYFPLARFSFLLESLGIKGIENLPLYSYRRASFYSMKTDALDRFGTRLEQRFTMAEIKSMMNAAGLERITFSTEIPYWCAVGYKRLT